MTDEPANLVSAFFMETVGMTSDSVSVDSLCPGLCNYVLTDIRQQN